MSETQSGPRILFLGNNLLGAQVLRWLLEQGEQLVGLVIHARLKRKHGEQFLSLAVLHNLEIFDGSTLRTPETLTSIQLLEPDIGISVLFDYILKPEFLKLLPRGCLNLHPAYLPYNKGQYPNVWSIVEGNPSGTTLHYIDSGIDTGDIVAQELVPTDLLDTGESLYYKLERASLDLFKRTWPAVRSGTLERVPQVPGEGTYHRTEDVEQIDRIDLDRQYTARELINLIRARTFPPYPGAYFQADDRRIYLRLLLEEGHESTADA